MKRKILCASAVLLFCLAGCKKNSTDTTTENSLKEQKTESDLACQMFVPVHTGAVTESNGPKNSLWPNGSILKVGFVGGSTSLRNKVKECVKTWEKVANITFSFIADDDATADIKVTFNGKVGYYGAAVGTEAKEYTLLNNPSMFLGFSDYASDNDMKLTILHEFGHALGLSHEQAHPDANIPWDTKAVYAYYMETAGSWTKEEVDLNILQVKVRENQNVLPYDPLSIMHYPIKAAFTTNRKEIKGYLSRKTISETDGLYMKKYYPGK